MTVMSRDPVDLRQLPIGIQYLISLSVVTVVVIAAWLVGRNQPVPTWLTTHLIPALGWLYIVLFSYVIIIRLFNKKD